MFFRLLGIRVCSRSWMACLISSYVSQTMGIHVLVSSNRLTLTIFILDWDAVLSVGDDVAVPALGQSNFLPFLFGWFFIFSFLGMLLSHLDLRFLIVCVGCLFHFLG
jgi:hypothetical protein